MINKGNKQLLPPIPDKYYFTIGEVSALCAIKPHVLRFWEKEFHCLAPVKRKGNRRYYRQTDLVMVREIRTLLYEKGFTIDGARKQLLQDLEQSPSFVEQTIIELEKVLQILR